MDSLFSLSEKTVLVTGGTRGMGLAIASAAGKGGARVVITGQTAGSVAEAVGALGRQGVRALGFPFDVSRTDQANELSQRLRESDIAVDGLVLAAAAPAPEGRLTEQGPDAFSQAMSSVQTSIELVRLLVPSMMKKKDGSIIAISSRTAKRGSVNLGMYGMSKAAIDVYVRSLALELGPYNVNVNSICPGPVRTAFSRGLWEDPAKEEALKQIIPMRRIGEPDDVAGLALLLLGPAGRFIHGQNISVDGGVTA